MYDRQLYALIQQTVNPALLDLVFKEAAHPTISPWEKIKRDLVEPIALPSINEFAGFRKVASLDASMLRDDLGAMVTTHSSGSIYEIPAYLTEGLPIVSAYFDENNTPSAAYYGTANNMTVEEQGKTLLSSAYAALAFDNASYTKPPIVEILENKYLLFTPRLGGSFCITIHLGYDSSFKKFPQSCLTNLAFYIAALCKGRIAQTLELSLDRYMMESGIQAQRLETIVDTYRDEGSSDRVHEALHLLRGALTMSDMKTVTELINLQL